MRSPFLVLAIGALVAPAAGCRPTLQSAAAVPALATAPNDGLARCKVAASLDRPLVTEWPASEKASLEAQVREGGVAVAYSGCAMRVLPQCHVRGAYHWSRTTPSTDYIDIKSEDELFAKLPLGAASLEGELARSGQLVVTTTVAGYLRLDSASQPTLALEGRCDGATHVVAGLAIGAFALKSGASARGEIKAGAFGGEASGKSSGEGELIRQAGEAERCGGATDEAPDAGCASPIQIFLLPADAPQDAGFATGAPGAGGPRRAPSPTEVPIEVVSADPDISWEVYVDGAKACDTPCSHVARPRSTIRLKEDRFFLGRESSATVKDLRDWAEVGGVRIEARSSSMWSMPGLMRMGGLFYALVGAGMLIPCLAANDDPELYCTMSGITAAIGIPLFATGTWLMTSHGDAATSPLR